MVRDGHRERAARERLSRASRCACRRDVGGADLSFAKTTLRRLFGARSVP